MRSAIEVQGRSFDAVPVATFDCKGCAADGNEAFCESLGDCVKHAQAPVVWVERKLAG